MDCFRNVSGPRVVIAKNGRLAALPDLRLLKQPRGYAPVEFAPFLLQKRGGGGFLNRNVLEYEEGGLGLLDAIDDPGALQSLQRVFKRFASARKHVAHAQIFQLPSEDECDRSHA